MRNTWVCGAVLVAGVHGTALGAVSGSDAPLVPTVEIASDGRLGFDLVPTFIAYLDVNQVGGVGWFVFAEEPSRSGLYGRLTAQEPITRLGPDADDAPFDQFLATSSFPLLDNGFAFAPFVFEPDFQAALVSDGVVLRESGDVVTINGESYTLRAVGVRFGDTTEGLASVWDMEELTPEDERERAVFIGTEPVLVTGQTVDLNGTSRRITSLNGADATEPLEGRTQSYMVFAGLDIDGQERMGILRDGAVATMVDGGPIVEGFPVGESAGGLPGESWSELGEIGQRLGVVASGDWFASVRLFNPSTGEIDAIIKNGRIVQREGELVQYRDGTLQLSSHRGGVAMNESGDLASLWSGSRVSGPGFFRGAVWIVNGVPRLIEGDAVDFNGDGVIDAADGGKVIIEELSTFFDGDAVAVGSRGSDGSFDAYLVAQVGADQLDDEPVGIRLTVPGGATNTPCGADLDNSGAVDLADLLTVLADFGQAGTGDLDGSGVTDLADLLFILSAFGTDCAP